MEIDNMNWKLLAAATLTIITITLFLSVNAISTQNIENQTITLQETSLYKTKLTIINSTITVNGSFTTLYSEVTITNSTITLAENYTGNFNFLYGTLNLENIEFKNWGTTNNEIRYARTAIKNATFTNTSITISAPQTFNINGLTFKDSPINTNFLHLYKVSNGEIRNVQYTLTKKYTNGGSSAISLVKCENLRLSNINGTGKINVSSPHFHIVVCGDGNRNISVTNSAFYGGGNGAITGIDYWENVTFTYITDGIERFKWTPTTLVNCTWTNITDSEINLQDGITLTLIRCILNKGLINLSNGTAYTYNCHFPNGITTLDMGDNYPQSRPQPCGELWQYWNLTSRYAMSHTYWSENLNYTLTPP